MPSEALPEPPSNGASTTLEGGGPAPAFAVVGQAPLPPPSAPPISELNGLQIAGSTTGDQGGPALSATTHVALDSGTGETKVLLLKRNGGSVEVTEMAKLDSLKGLFAGTVDAAAVANLVREIRSVVDAASPSHCFAGLTSWFRTADEVEQKAVEAFFRDSLPEFEVLKLSGHEEALKESIAVTFAAEKSGIGKPDTQVAAGGGSMQLVQGSEVYSLEQGFREGQAELMGSRKRSLATRVLEGRAAARFATFMDENPAFAVTPGIVVGISAAYYAAKGARIDCKKGVLASEAHELFKIRRDELVAKCSPEEANSPVSNKKVAQEIANVIIFCELFEQMIHPDSEIFFRRNWELDGAPFITTWSAGHFLQHMDDQPPVAPPSVDQAPASPVEVATRELQQANNGKSNWRNAGEEVMLQQMIQKCQAEPDTHFSFQKGRNDDFFPSDNDGDMFGSSSAFLSSLLHAFVPSFLPSFLRLPPFLHLPFFVLLSSFLPSLLCSSLT